MWRDAEQIYERGWVVDYLELYIIRMREYLVSEYLPLGARGVQYDQTMIREVVMIHGQTKERRTGEI